MDRRRKLLVNTYEVATNSSLQRVVAKQNAKVCPKVRVADALDINNSGLTNEEFSYALKAHFDFVITDAESVSQFAVEFDEDHHYSDSVAMKNDMLKNVICDKLEMPLLRIDRAYLQRVERFATVLDWLIEMWYMEQEWNRAYSRGDLPPDADFWPFLIFELGYIENGNFVPLDRSNIPADVLEELNRQGRIIHRSYDPFVAYINTIRKLANEGICLDPYPDYVDNTDWENGYSAALAFVQVPQNRYVSGEIRCRVSNFITGGFEIARNLAIVDCVYRLFQYKQGKYMGLSMLELESRKTAIQKGFQNY